MPTPAQQVPLRDQTGWQIGDHLKQLTANDLGLDKNRLAALVNAMQSEYILGKIDP